MCLQINKPISPKLVANYFPQQFWPLICAANPYTFQPRHEKEYSPPQRLEGNESPVFVDISGCVAAFVHKNFYSEVEHSNLCQIAFGLIDIDFVLINMPP